MSGHGPQGMGLGNLPGPDTNPRHGNDQAEPENSRDGAWRFLVKEGVELQILAESADSRCLADLH